MIFLVWGGVASASDLPTLYAVIGIPNDQVLAIQSAPAEESETLAAFRFNASGVEVVNFSKDGAWGQVNLAETSGWVLMKHLTPFPADTATRMTCFGNEPFWTLELGPETTGTWKTPDSDGMVSFKKADSGRIASGEIRMTEASVLSGAHVPFEATITPQICSDGMSDRVFGLSTEILLKGYSGFASPDGDQTRSGCCSISLP
jgi:uncharacterized membrane protein